MYDYKGFVFVISFVHFVSAVYEESIFPSLPVGVPKSDNIICDEQSKLFLENLKNKTLWAHEMWDATAKSSSGILRGSIFQMGHFDQCITARAPFTTQYCLATITVNIPKPENERDPISLYHHPEEEVFERLYYFGDKSQQSRNVAKLGWCVPESCSSADLTKSLNKYLEEIEHPFKDHNITYIGLVSPEVCQTEKESMYYNGADIAFCLLAALLAILVIVSTVYEYNLKHDINEKPMKRSRFHRLVMSFSAKQNFRDLTKADESNPALSILYGMRTILILMIIMDHRFGTFTSSALLNFDYLETQYRSPLACFLFHGDMFVDSFFILSGILVVYSLLNQFDKRRLNPGYIIFLRYIRLTPVYAFVIFYYATLFNYTGSGPLWKIIAGGDSQDCKDNWWTNLLYISNYVNADHMCMTHSWYLPCDFHYFIIAIGICILIKKEKKMGMLLLILLTIVSIIIPFTLTLVYQRPALLYFYPEFLTGPKIHPDFLLTYSKSHTRATPYFIGMFAGYVYYRQKGSNYHICRIKSSIIIAASLALILASILGGAVFYNPYHEYDALESAFYAGLHKLAWSIGSIGLLYIASYGHANLIYTVLTWSPLIPLSKLVYGAYLIHMQFQLRSAAKFMTPQKIGYFDVISLSLSDMVLAFVSALILYLAVEAPFRRIFRELLMPHREPIPKEVQEPLPARQNMMNNNNNDCDSRL